MTDSGFRRLDEISLRQTVGELCSLDHDLKGVVARYGPPPLWAREPGFATLVHIILEQQVSLASANAAFRRLQVSATPLTPPVFLQLDDAHLRQIGFSQQKMRYCRALATAILQGELNLEALGSMDDAHVRAQLMQIKGIGTWSANIYLMEVLLRPDIWPVGDLALANAVQQVKGLGQRPDPAQLMHVGERYRPWRSVAARIFWHDYLSRRNGD